MGKKLAIKPIWRTRTEYLVRNAYYRIHRTILQDGRREALRILRLEAPKLTHREAQAIIRHIAEGVGMPRISTHIFTVKVHGWLGKPDAFRRLCKKLRKLTCEVTDTGVQV